MSEPADLALGAWVATASPGVARALDLALQGRELSVRDALPLQSAAGRDLLALCAVADHLRERQCGAQVGYVVNRNINFTNVCAMSCKFCAFSRTRRSEEGYFLDQDEIVRRVLQARALGATEVCLQAGLHPDTGPTLYTDLLRAIKAAAPDIHIHALSPEEVKFGAERAGLPVTAFLAELKDAGLDTLPGTSAEILDDAVRRRIAGGRITTAEWLEVVQAAHRAGLPTTCTIMYGHLETPEQVLRHLALLRSVQYETGGFTEFVPLSFVHTEAPLFMKEMASELRPGPTGNEVVRMIAVARLMLGGSIRNVQTSWVKEGLRTSQWLLSCGANDLGGTLMNESISTAAGASHGQLMRPAELRRAIREAGREPVERNTRYGVVRGFSVDGHDDPTEPLDAVEDAEREFGSYVQLTAAARARSA